MLFLEALYIKNLAPKINDGLKATRELVLFQQSSDWLTLTFGKWSVWYSDCFVELEQFCVLIFVLSKSDNCFFYILSKFDNSFDREIVDLNWPFNHWLFWISCHFAAIKQLHRLIIVLSKFDNCFFCTFLLYAFKILITQF